MNKKHFALLVIVAVLSGLVGGAVSTFLLMPQSVLAQDSPQKVIEAEELATNPSLQHIGQVLFQEMEENELSEDSTEGNISKG